MAVREGPSAALVSFAELGGAEEEEEEEVVVGAGSDAARFLGAPLVYLFISRGYLQVFARSTARWEGGGGRARGKGELEPGSKRRLICR